MLPDEPVPLSNSSPGCALEATPRNIQNGSEVYYVSLNRNWLSQLGIGTQGSPTLHALVTRPVTIQYPAIIIQPAELVE